MIKAVRLVNGFNPDLRITLKGINKGALYEWIDANYYGIFGVSEVKPSWDSPEWDRYERKIWNAVNQVISGRCDG
jgi:hypothetical protein